MQVTLCSAGHMPPRPPAQIMSLRGWKPVQTTAEIREIAPSPLGAALAALLASTQLAVVVGPAAASIPLQPLTNQQSQALSQLGGRYAVPSAAQRAPPLRDEPPMRQQIQMVMELMQQAADASAAGDYQQALTAYTTVTQNWPDFAITEYARIGRALTLYELGRTREAIVLLEDEEVVLRGRPEVHAALAAMLYASGRPEQRLAAERQWDIVEEFDTRYANPDWVAANKHWPPRLMAALNAFLTLS